MPRVPQNDALSAAYIHCIQRQQEDFHRCWLMFQSKGLEYLLVYMCFMTPQIVDATSSGFGTVL